MIEILQNHFFAIFKVSRPAAFQTEMRPKTFETETRKNGSRDESRAVVTLKIYNPDLDRLHGTHFSTLGHCCLGFHPYFRNRWLGSTNQPLCLAAAISIS